MDFYSEIDVFKEIKEKILNESKFIKGVFEYSNNEILKKNLIDNNKIYAILDFSNTRSGTISCNLDTDLIIHLCIRTDNPKGLNIATRELRKILKGFSKTVVQSTIPGISGPIV